jgi:hypothetical protein
MISTRPRPLIALPRLQEKIKKQRLPKGKLMTIAIGMICDGGLILAADTRITIPSTGATSEAVKIKQAQVGTARYVISYASDNSNSGESLQQAILSDLEGKKPTSLAEVSPIIESTMAKWSKAYTLIDDRPSTEIVLGALFGSTEIGLFHCEPPKSVVRKGFQDASGYVAIGAGNVITGPLFRILFGELVSPHTCLCQISYLMHRAKIDYAGYCGGETDAIFLRADTEKPIWIERLDMKVAESFGPRMDRALSKTAASVISEREWENPKAPLSLASDISQFGLPYRMMKFRSRTGEIIS